MVALAIVAPQPAQEVGLLGLLDTFGQHLEAQALAQRDHRAGDGGVLGIIGQAAHETLIELKLVYRQAFQPRQRAITGAEVVDGQAHAQCAQAGKQFQGCVRVFHDRALGHFQLQLLGWQAGGSQHAGNFLVQLASAEQAAGDVHCDEAERAAFGVPVHHLATGLLQHPGVDGADHAVVLGNRDKFAWRNQPALRVLPAYQCLHAYLATVTQVMQRLVVNAQLVIVQGMAQAAGQFHALTGVVGQLLHIEGIAFAAAALGLEQRRIGIAQDLLDAIPIVGEQADADAGADVEFMTVEEKGRVQAMQQTLRQFGSLGGFRAVFAEQAEFVTAQPGQGAACRQIVLQALANALEQ